MRLVWITMLAIANRDGVIEASIPGLADASKVSIDECIEALSRLSAPDEYSRSQEYDGRRVAEVEGGWLLLNYAKYRGALLEDRKREQARIRQQLFRSRNADSNASHKKSVTSCYSNARNGSGSGSGSGSDPNILVSNNNKKKKICSTPEGFAEWYAIYPRHQGRADAEKAFRTTKLPPLEELLDATRNHVRFWEENGTELKYIPLPAGWLRKQRWNDELKLKRDAKKSPINSPYSELVEK